MTDLHGRAPNVVCAAVRRGAHHRLKPSEHTEATLSWNLQDHGLQLLAPHYCLSCSRFVLTELAKLRRPLVEDLVAKLPQDSVERRLCHRPAGSPGCLVRLPNLPRRKSVLEAGAPSGERRRTICSMCGQELAEFDQDLREAAAEDEYADLAFEMARRNARWRPWRVKRLTTGLLCYFDDDVADVDRDGPNFEVVRGKRSGHGPRDPFAAPITSRFPRKD